MKSAIGNLNWEACQYCKHATEDGCNQYESDEDIEVRIVGEAVVCDGFTEKQKDEKQNGEKDGTD